MNMKYLKGAVLAGILCAFSIPHRADAQTCSMLASVELPRGVSRLDDCPAMNVVAGELLRVMNDPSKELLEVLVCGSASPDGLWAYNEKLSQARADAGAEYLKEAVGISENMIRKVSLNEDWNRLYELVESSDIIYKNDVLTLIRTKDWGERKTALRELGDGEVWKLLERDFFPKLRYVSFSISCRSEEATPYISKADTVYVRDTVYIRPETYYIYSSGTESAGQTFAEEPPAHEDAPMKYIYVPTVWRLALKTNLAADAVLPGNLGMEFQISDRMSLDVLGGYSGINAVFPCEDTRVYGVTPELRFYPKGSMRKGHFFGLHGNVLWYTLKGADGLIYQNISNVKPAWSVGLTYGYLLGFGKNDRWGLEFYAGAGYGAYCQKVGQWNEVDREWQKTDEQFKRHFGLTRFGINLTYRFDIKKLNVYYDE